MRKTKDRKVLPGRISIIRNNRNEISIELEDESSSLTLIEIGLTPEQFGLAVTNLSAIPCEFVIYGGVALAGKKLEVKHEKLQGLTYQNFVTEFPNAVAPFEVDGWKVDHESSFNHHKGTKDGYTVIFRRYVDPEPKEERRD